MRGRARRLRAHLVLSVGRRTRLRRRRLATLEVVTFRRRHLDGDGTRRVGVLVDEQHVDGATVALQVDLVDLLHVRRLMQKNDRSQNRRSQLSFLIIFLQDRPYKIVVFCEISLFLYLNPKKVFCFRRSTYLISQCTTDNLLLPLMGLARYGLYSADEAFFFYYFHFPISPRMPSVLAIKGTRHKQNSLSGNTLFNYMPTYTRSQKKS